MRMSNIRADPGRRSHIYKMDYAKSCCASMRTTGCGRDRRLPDRPARGSHRLRRHGDVDANGPDHRVPRESRQIRRPRREIPSDALAVHGDLRVQVGRSCASCCWRTLRGSQLQPRFRRRSHPGDRQEREGDRPTGFRRPVCVRGRKLRPIGVTWERWMRSGGPILT